MEARSTATLVLALSLPAAAVAQEHGQEHPAGHEGMREGPLGIPESREGSGTSWLPDASPMYGLHGSVGAWDIMLHGNVFLQYIDDESDGRGDAEVGSINWVMLMASAPLAGGELELRGMFSLEPATIPGCGYPDLLATGEVCDGERIVDEQHPHDLFMELAAEYSHELTEDVALGLYAGLSGEPALGPTAYPHRISAFPNPIAPVTHHWLDATHITFGVVTAQVFGRRWKVEGSIFNGREPDDERWDLDLAALGSYSGRVWLLPSDRWALQISAGKLVDAEEQLEHGGGHIDVIRATASVTYHLPLGGPDVWATTAAWGMNAEEGERASNAAFLETNLTLDRNIVFARGEVVEKGAEDLGLEAFGEQTFTVGKITAGYTRELGPVYGLVPGIGGQALVSVLPSELENVYGTRVPLGFALFLRLHPDAMEH